PEPLEGQPTGLLQSSITRFITGSSSDPTDLPAFYKRLANTSPAALPSEMGLMQLHMETNPALPSGGIAALASAVTAAGVAVEEHSAPEVDTAGTAAAAAT
ncbi:hypothetical protein Vretifemale_13848, partial [Volvox reticuliferus]